MLTLGGEPCGVFVWVLRRSSAVTKSLDMSFPESDSCRNDGLPDLVARASWLDWLRLLPLPFCLPLGEFALGDLFFLLLFGLGIVDVREQLLSLIGTPSCKDKANDLALRLLIR